MEEKVFLIDCDEVLRQTLSKMIEVYNKHFPDSQKKIEDVIDFKTEISFREIEKLTGQTPSHWFFQEHGKEMFLDTEPFPYVKEDIETLKKYGKVIVLTYQKTYANKMHTLEWLENVGIEPDGICFMKDKTLVKGDYLIDDNDWNFKNNKVKYGVLINAPYNEHKTTDEVLKTSYCEQIERFSSLHDFVMTYEKAHKEVELAKEKYYGKVLCLTMPVPYVDLNNRNRAFGYVGLNAVATKIYLKNTIPMISLISKDGLSGCSATINDFEKCV